MGAFWLYTPAKRTRLVEEAWGDVKDEIYPVSFEPAKIAVHAWLMDHGHMSGGINATRKKNRDPDYFWSHSGSCAIGVLSGLVSHYAVSGIVSEGGDNEEIQDYLDNHYAEVSLAIEGDSLSDIRENVSQSQASTGWDKDEETEESTKKQQAQSGSSLSFEKTLLVVLAGVAVYLILKK